MAKGIHKSSANHKHYSDVSVVDDSLFKIGPQHLPPNSSQVFAFVLSFKPSFTV